MKPVARIPVSSKVQTLQPERSAEGERQTRDQSQSATQQSKRLLKSNARKP